MYIDMICLLLLIVVFLPSGESARCPRGAPSKRSLQRCLLRAETFGGMSSGSKEEPAPSSVTRLSLEAAASSPGCDDPRLLAGQEHVQDRSFCPWTTVINHDPYRYPSDIVEAQCRCAHGVGQGADTACEHVYHNVLVMRRTGYCTLRGHYEYTAAWERIAVGCTMTYVDATRPLS